MSKKKVNAPEAPRSADVWKRLVQEWSRSRQVTREFCQARGLSMKTFQWWRWALRMRGGRVTPRPDRPRPDVAVRPGAVVKTSPSLEPAFIEVVQRDTATRSALAPRQVTGVEVVVAGAHGDRRVRVDADFDMATLRQVVSALEEV